MLIYPPHYTYISYQRKEINKKYPLAIRATEIEKK